MVYMKILLLDLETAPSLAYIWRMFKEFIRPSQIVENGYILCYTAKWLNDDKIFFDSVWNSGEKKMLDSIYKLLDEADAVVHYNGNKFDIPTLNREFIKNKMSPPSPSKNIDLYNICKRHIALMSYSLDYVCRYFGLGEKKVIHFETWKEIINGNKEEEKVMEEYNKHDVIILEGLYNTLKPWIRVHPNFGLHSELGLVCPNCGGNHYHRRGYSFTYAGKYQRFQCQGCGNWFRNKKAEQTNVFVNAN